VLERNKENIEGRKVASSYVVGKSSYFGLKLCFRTGLNLYR